MSSDPTPDARPLRADAARNRDRIITAARELYATRGLSVGLNEIAHHAGLGVGTAYRRFPDKQQLVELALAEPLREITEVAAEAQRAARAWDGLMLVLERGAALLAANLGLRDVALGPDGDLEGLTPHVEGFAEIVCGLMDRARAEGDLRQGVTHDDLTLILWMVSELAAHSVEVEPEAYRRYLRLVTDGLREGPGLAELAPALTTEQVTEIARHWAAH
ncbi:helix-turn-helix domain-containing protein [Cellulomonas sp. NPDC089187]|uniref:TetR/AcrR family transcriptional regulator n=1 Tax=Cellulomonas sp. NPDC089187 TaxID=3154970 RepID=UPI00342A373B